MSKICDIVRSFGSCTHCGGKVPCAMYNMVKSLLKGEDMIGEHYKYEYKGIKVDPYRILDVYGIFHPAQAHAIKKLLRAGKSIKSLDEDIKEVINSLERWLEMIKEDK